MLSTVDQDMSDRVLCVHSTLVRSHFCCQWLAVGVVGKSVTAQSEYPGVVRVKWRSLWQLV